MTPTLTYLLYWLLQALAFPLLLLYLVRRIAKNRVYARHLGERFGLLPPAVHPTLPGAVWLHAVSVGEVIAAIPLIQALREALPDAPVYVSTSTIAGRAMAESKLSTLAAGVFYAPLDYRFAVRRVLRRLRPALLIVMETEIWPNMLREAKRSGAGVLIVNARISDKALPRYRRYSWFFRQALRFTDAALAQDETAAARYRMVGAPVVEVAGNLKYDFDPASARVAPDLEAWIRAAAPAQILIAASTMPPAHDGDVDEDDLVIEAWKQLAVEQPGLLLILGPRRPERFDAAARKLEAAGIGFTRRTALGNPSRVLLVDTIGELNGLFRHATLVFMGGTLAERGGHNVLEPAAFATPVICGPHMENFAEIAAEFDRAGALARLDQTNFGSSISLLLNDMERLAQLGAASLVLAEAKRGATARSIQTISAAYDTVLPRPVPPVIMIPLTWLWRAGMALDRVAKRLRGCRPEARVISVGNVALGGTGKTPMVLWLCEKLAASGVKVGVLTRGYGRQGGRGVEVFEAAAAADVSAVGEEAALILRQGKAWVGVGPDRCKAWRVMRDRGGPKVIILDDGFQHWRMKRDSDVVLIDALDPFRGGLLPLGRSREPFSALKRATAIVITRTQKGREYRGLITEIRRHSNTTPIFRARVAAIRPEIGVGPVGVFCGIGQPAGFEQTLKEIGIAPMFVEVFPDHHHYSEAEIAALRARAPVLVTTEKDLMNVPATLRTSVHAVPITLELNDPDGFLAVVARL